MTNLDEMDIFKKLKERPDTIYINETGTAAYFMLPGDEIMGVIIGEHIDTMSIEEREALIIKRVDTLFTQFGY